MGNNRAMVKQPPFPPIDDILAGLGGRLVPPVWLVVELQNRLLLLINHVLSQEPQAMDRLRRQRGKCIGIRWREHGLQVQATPAGLLERVERVDTPDLALTITDDSASHLLQTLIAGEKPTVRIEGDVQLAAEVNWLVDHVRWDLEEDLARLLGDAPAHALARAATQARDMLRQFASRMPRPARPA
jgi:ubiquinone biosynthesis protein UbiJ